MKKEKIATILMGKKPKSIKNYFLQNKKRDKELSTKKNKEKKKIADILIKQKSKSKVELKIKSHILNTRNINDYHQLITDQSQNNISNLYWLMKLRETNKKLELENKTKHNKRNKVELSDVVQSPKKLTLTQFFKEPDFYNTDLEKYKEKIKKYRRPLSSVINPNFNMIRHLSVHRSFNQSNSSQFEFSASLRDPNPKHHLASSLTPKKRDKKEGKIPWNNCFSAIKSNKNLSIFLLPKSTSGLNLYKKLDKYLYKPFKTIYQNAVLKGETIKQKVLVPNTDYTFDGIGEHLGSNNYHSHYGLMNSCAGEKILKKGTNSLCLFEFGLRNYPSISNKKFKTEIK